MVVIAFILFKLLGSHPVTYIVIGIVAVVYGIMVNFFRCPIRMYLGPTVNSVVAPADGKVVVVEEVDEDEYFHDKRIMVSIFMSLYTVIIYAMAHPVAGWTTTLLFLSVAFFSLFGILTVVIKYLQILVDLVFRRKRYSYESIQKFSGEEGEK